MRPSKPEYESEPDGLDLDAMFQRLMYRVSVGAPGRDARLLRTAGALIEMLHPPKKSRHRSRATA